MYRAALAALVLVGCGRAEFDFVADASDECSIPTGVIDDFGDPAPDPIWLVTHDPDAMIDEATGRLVVTFASVPVKAYGAYKSASTYDLRDHCVFVTVVETPAPAPRSEMALQLSRTTGAIGVGIVAVDGNLLMYSREGTTFTSLAVLPLDLGLQRRWRLRESSGTMFWETFDGTAWTIQFTEPTPFDLSAVTINLYAGSLDQVTNPGRAVYDDLDVR